MSTLAMVDLPLPESPLKKMVRPCRARGGKLKAKCVPDCNLQHLPSEIAAAPGTILGLSDAAVEQETIKSVPQVPGGGNGPPVDGP